MNQFTQKSSIQTRYKHLVQGDQSISRLLQTLIDQAVVLALLVAHTYIKTGDFSEAYIQLAISTALLMGISYSANGLYQYHASFTGRLWSLIKSWATVITALILIGFITKTSEEYSREVILTWTITGFLAQSVTYSMITSIQTRYFHQEIPSLLIGAQALGKHLVEHINNSKVVADRIVGVLEDSTELAEAWNEENTPYMGNLSDIKQTIALHNIRRLYIALPMKDAELIKPLYLQLVDENVDIIWAPDIFGVNLLNHQIKEIAGVPLISLSETPLLGSQALLKSLFDKFFALIGLVLLSPLMLLIALLVKLGSKGPVLFKQPRHGWDGDIIKVWKFRSMVVHTEDETTITQATKGDSRITPLGAFIRKTSIDELPQLINVLMGDMSLVGPRPHAVAHNHFYRDKIDTYMARHRVKPGITGLAQVNGFRGETETLDKMEQRVKYDLAYINNWSLWLDIQIILRTVFVLFGKDVY